MLKVVIPAAKLTELGQVGYEAYIIGALREGGVPLSPVFGLLTKGTLDVFKDPKTLSTIYLWKE